VTPPPFIKLINLAGLNGTTMLYDVSLAVSRLFGFINEINDSINRAC